MWLRAMALALAILFAATAACGVSPDQGRGPTVLTLWARSDQQAFLQQIIDGFNRSQRDVRVVLTIVPADNFVQKLGVAVAGDAGPDLASIDIVYVPLFASSGVLADITAKTRGLPHLNKLSGPHRSNAEYRGRTYALPFSGDASVLYYNVDLFRAAGLDPDRPPRTWGEMYRAARKIRALGGDHYGYFFSGAGGGPNIFTFTPLIWASGGDVLSSRGGKERPLVGVDPTVTDALRFYRKMWTDGLIDPQSAADSGEQGINTFGSGKIGMYPTGAFGLNTLKEDYPNLNFRVTPLPGKHGGSSSFTGGDDIAITENSRHRDEAWRFLAWSTRADVQRRYFGDQGVIPVREDIALRDYSRKGPEHAALAKALVNGQTVRSVQENALINSDTSPWATMISRGVFEGAAEQAADQAQSDMENILSRG
ncbi:MAG: extracellular solute-binding protein [Pseudonocardiaceae bacterium]|nr:extracellular solute-binding protein [Pseudonocardiaceae bacterium]